VVHGCDSRAGDRCGSFWYRFPSLLRAGCLAVSTLRWPRRPKRQQGCHRLSISSPQKSKAAPLTSSTALGAPSTDGLQNTISRNAGSGEPPGDQWSIAATRSKLSEFLGFAAAKTRPPAKKRSSGRAFSCAAAMPASRSLSRVAAICTAPVQLRFDAARSPNLDASTRARLRPLAGRRMTADGVVVIIGRRFRTQERNRQDVSISFIGRPSPRSGASRLVRQPHHVSGGAKSSSPAAEPSGCAGRSIIKWNDRPATGSASRVGHPVE